MKKHALQIFRAALDAADPQHAVLRHLTSDGRTLIAGRHRYSLTEIERVFVVGAGKASAGMASAVERLLGRRITDGHVNVPDGVSARTRRIHLHEARHPLPDERGLAGAHRIAELARQASERDLVIAVISGGASALLPAPVPGLSLEDKQAMTRALMNAGANIHELNTVRKHLSTIKGGRLASLAYPARTLTLIFSDVIGDDLDVIGSGPTVGDRSSIGDARAVFEKYGLDAPDDLLSESPKPGDDRLRRVQNLIIGSNKLAIDAAAARAKELGYKPLILSTMIEGETREVAKMHAAIAKEISANHRPAKPPVCVLSGGETTCTVRGSGLGGRNQEFVLAAAIALEGAENTVVFSGGTDGLDGPTDAAGAIADGQSIARASALGLDARAFLANNDSYHFFAPLNGLVKTGPTGTNVMDIRAILIR